MCGQLILSLQFENISEAWGHVWVMSGTFQTKNNPFPAASYCIVLTGCVSVSAHSWEESEKYLFILCEGCEGHPSLALWASIVSKMKISWWDQSGAREEERWEMQQISFSAFTYCIAYLSLTKTIFASSKRSNVPTRLISVSHNTTKNYLGYSHNQPSGIRNNNEKSSNYSMLLFLLLYT